MSNNKEVNALAPISKDQRESWVSLALVQAGICVCVPAFLMGALLVEEMNFWPAIWAGTAGAVLVVAAMIIIGFIGCDLGLATCTITESTFGKKGSRYIASTIFMINLIGWFGINNGECAMSFTNFMSECYGIHFPYTASCILWGIVMTVTAVFGIKAVEKLDYVSIPVLLIVMIVGTAMAVNLNGLQTVNTPIEPTMTIMEGVILSFDFFAVGIITSSDFTRFQKSRKDTVLSVTIGVFPLTIITLVIGAMLTKIANEYDISMVLIKVGIPLLGVISLILSTWTTNSTNAYTGALNAVKTFNVPDNRRREVTLAVGFVGTLLGVTGIVDNLSTFIGFLAYLVCPIGGIMLADYFILGKGKSENWRSRDGFCISAIIAWAVSAVLSYIIKIDFSSILFAAVIFIVIERYIPALARDKQKVEKE